MKKEERSSKRKEKDVKMIIKSHKKLKVTFSSTALNNRLQILKSKLNEGESEKRELKVKI